MWYLLYILMENEKGATQGDRVKENLPESGGLGKTKEKLVFK